MSARPSFPVIPSERLKRLMNRSAPSLFLASKLLTPPPSQYPFSKKDAIKMTDRMTQSMTSIRNKPWVYDRVYVKSIIKFALL